MKRLCIIFFLTVFVVFPITPTIAADDVYEIKLSVDTNMNHHRNKGLKVFMNFLERNSKGRLKVNFFHSGQLYKDRDIPKAMKLGTVDMAAPGIWQLEGVDPNTAITALPMFYGLPTHITKELIDGQVGGILNESLEKKMGVKIPGKWYYHGYLHICSKGRKITKLDDFNGLKIRHHGGAANALRLKALGASPVMIPWPDLPMAIVQGTADGFVTTFKSFDSAKLWDTGAKFATADKEYYLHYVPMINRQFWDKLPQDLQKVILDTWEEHIDIQRAISEFEQKKGEDNMKINGVSIFYPSDEELAKWRDQALSLQSQMVDEIGLDKDLVANVEDVVNKALK